MKILLYFVLISLSFFFISSLIYAQFLPEPTGDQFGLEYGESIVGRPVNPPQIDGNLDDWKYAVWIGFNSDKELFRGRGVWKGKDDLSVTWATMYDDKNFYFAAAVRDDMFAPSDNPAEPWRGDMIFLYIDWAGNKAEVSSKPGFAMSKGKPTVSDFSGGKNPRLSESKISIVANSKLGKGGMVYEVEMPFNFLTNEKIDEGKAIGFTPGYEEGTDNPEGRAGLVFMDWGGVDPDQARNLGKLKFGGKLLVNSADKLADAWGRIKSIIK